MRFFILFLCLYHCLLAQAKEGDDLKATSFAEKEVTDLMVIEGVNVITGSYSSSMIDAEISAPFGLFLQRHYAPWIPLTRSVPKGCWRDRFEWRCFSMDSSVCVLDGTGSLKKYDKAAKTESYHLFPGSKSGYTNAGSGILSGQTHLKNSILTAKQGWELREGDGTCRWFSKSSKDPKQANCLQEKRPDGHRLAYTYHNEGRLQKVRLMNTQGTTTYAWAEYKRPAKLSDSPFVEIALSNGQRVKMEYSLPDHRFLKSVTPAEGPKEDYTYQDDSWGDERYLLRRILPAGREIHLHYYNRNHIDYFHKVESISRPIGPSGEMLPCYTFYYDVTRKDQEVKKGITVVKDALGYITEYKYDDTLRLRTIQKFNQKKKLDRLESFAWGKSGKPDAGNLKLRCWVDCNEHAQVAIQYFYDDCGNVLEKHLHGQITGDQATQLKVESHEKIIRPGEVAVSRYTYSNDGLNLLLSEVGPEGHEVRYGYKSGTNLLTSKFLYEGSGEQAEVRQRQFLFYDADGILVKRVEDDGSTYHCKDLTQVTQRQTTSITPYRELGLYGLPHVIEEKALDLATGKEHLLKKAVRNYTSTGKLEKEEIFDSNNILIGCKSFSYNSMGLPIYECDLLGREATYTYDANGNRLSSEWMHQGYKTLFTYDKMNRLIKIEEIHHDGVTFTTSCSYDLKGNKVSETDRFGQTTHYEYNVHGEVVKILYPAIYDGEKTIYPECRYSYDCRGNKTEEVDAKGYSTKTRYNAYGQPLEILYSDGTAEHFRYNLDGTLREKTAPNGTTTQITYDYLKRPTQEEEISSSGELLSRKTMRYNAFHLLEEINAEGGEIHYTYDFAGRQSSIRKVDPNGQESLSELLYDSCGRLWKILEWVGANAHITIKEYDLDNHLIEERVEDGQGKLYSKTCWVYDLEGRQIIQKQFVRDDLSAVTITDYNSRGEVVCVTDPLGNKTLFSYDYSALNALGQRILKTTETDALGRKKLFSYDAYGRQHKLQRLDPFGKLIESRELFYDGNGSLIKAVDQVLSAPDQQKENVTTLWSYGPKNRLEKLVEAAGTPLQKTTQYRYNNFGQRSELIKPDGTILYSTYDAHGRLERHSSSDSRLSYLYSYNKLGEVLEVLDGITGLVTQREVDRFGKLLYEQQATGATVSYSYDALDRKSALTLSDNSSIFWEYNANYLEKVGRKNRTGQELYAHRYEYDLQGRWNKGLLHNGIEVQREFDLCGRAVALETPQFSQRVPEGGYDAVGNQRKLTTIDAFGSLDQELDYDDRNRLISERGESSHIYNYDSLDNRTAKDGDPYSVNSLNQIQGFSDERFEYDANGNLIKRLGKEGTWLYTYDPLDRLIEAALVNERRITFSYDPFNRRLSKAVENWNETTHSWQQQKCLHFLYDGQDEIGALDESGTIVELRVLGNGLGAEISAAIACELNGNLYIPLHDMQGSVRALLNQNGETIAGYRYSAFGETEESFGSITCPWQFSAKRLDPETGFLNFGRRYYLPELGRWLNPDPQGFEDGPNLYAYVHNNPLTHIDLYGLIDRPKDNNSRFGSWLSSAANFAVDFVAGGLLDVGASLAKDYYKGREHEGGAFSRYLLKRDVDAWSDLSRGAALGLIACAGLEVCPLKLLGKAAKSATTCAKQCQKTLAREVAETAVKNQAKIEACSVKGGAYNRATFEKYKVQLRRDMEKPYVENADLKHFMNELYRSNGSIGNGSTAAAIRYEMATNLPVKGKIHSQKGENYITCLSNWIRKNPNANARDRAAAENVLLDLKDAYGK